MSLRERKKAETRARIQEEAMRLFLAQGYDATTVDQIAEAAGVSHMTFFRNFPAKEDVVATDDYDPMMAELIRARPAGEPPGRARPRPRSWPASPRSTSATATRSSPVRS